MNRNVKNIWFNKSFSVKSLLFTFFLFVFISATAQDTLHFNTAPVFTSNPEDSAWAQTATVTLGGATYEFVNSVGAGWQYDSTRGFDSSANLSYNPSDDASVTIRRQDGERFQFHGAWVKYTNLANGHSPPWLTVIYGGSTIPDEIYGNNDTVILEQNENVTFITLSFSGLFRLRLDEVIVGTVNPVTPFSGTDTVSIFSDTSATFSGSVTDNGGAEVTESGIVYATSAAPTITDNKLALSSGVSSFSQVVNGLQRSTTYYVRSYATNSAGTSYGNEESFTTFGIFSIEGSHNFNSEWVSSVNQISPFKKYVEGWNVTGEDSGAGLISVRRLTGENIEEGLGAIRIASDTLSGELVYVSMQPFDSSLFNLQSFMFRYEVQDPNTTFGTVTVTGYRNGLAVPGAVKIFENIPPASSILSYNTFADTTNNFNNINEFRLTAQNSFDNARLYFLDIDAISATAGTVLPVTFTSIKAYQKSSGIQINWNVATENNVDHYEIEKSATGQQFTKTYTVSPKQNSYSSGSYNWFDANVFSGNNFYRIKSVFTSGIHNYSQILNVVIDASKQGIAVNPNPVIGNSINMQFNNQPKGIYTVQLFSNTGQKLYSKIFQHTGGSSTQTLDIKSNFTKGVYQLKVSGNSKSFTQLILKN